MKAIHNYLFTALAFVISAGVFMVYLSLNGFGSAQIGGFSEMLEGTAFRPIVYRLLIPVLARAGSNLVPTAVIVLFKNLPGELGIKQAFDELSNGKYYGEAISALLLMYLSIVGFMLVEKRFLKELGYSAKEQFVLPIMLAILILPFSVFFAFVYDLPQMFLFAACLLYLYQRKWTVYLIFLTIALLNKETAFLLIMIFAVYYFRRLPRNEFTILGAAQLSMFALVRAITMYLYRHNPGAVVFWLVQFHIDQYAKYPSTLGFTVIFFGAITYLIIKDWQRKPVFLRYASIVLPILLVLFLVAGMPMEFRVFLDSLSILGVMLFPAPIVLQPLEEVTSFSKYDTHSNL